MSGDTSAPTLSIVVPFADHEEVLGDACRQLAAHCRALGLGFELLAVDEGSGDNSHALLALLRSELPELRVVASREPHRAFTIGTGEARGRALLLIEPAEARRSLAPLARAVERVIGAVDLVVVPGRFVVARRTRALSALHPTRARGAGFEDRLARRARKQELAVEVWGEGNRRERTGVARLFGALLVAAGR